MLKERNIIRKNHRSRTKNGVRASAIGAGVLVAGMSLTACGGGGAGNAAVSTPQSFSAKAVEAITSHKPVTITYQLNGVSPNSPLQKVFNADIVDYEHAHPWVHVKYVITNTATDTQQSYLVTEAGGGHVPDITWDQYNEVDSGAIPSGILANMKPYFELPNPYAKGNSKWLDLWTAGARQYMTTPSGGMYLLVGSDVATGLFYNKADFAKAGISGTPTTFAQFLADLKKLKAAGFTPLLFGDGGTDNCNASWYERKFMSELLHNKLTSFDVNHSQIATGLDTAVGIKKGIISMADPAYAEGWKLLGELRPYLSPAGATYDACATLTASTPPLSEVPLLVSNKVAMAWGGSWFGYELNESGFKGKWGVFTFPEITTATTKYSANLNVMGVVGGPNGSGEVAVATPKADKAMTPEVMHWTVNLLQYLYSPSVEGQWIGGESSDSDIPLIVGAKVEASPVLEKLLPSKLPPTVIDGILDSALTTSAALTGFRLIQAYLSGSMSYSTFASQWESDLQQAASGYISANHIDIGKYVK